MLSLTVLGLPVAIVGRKPFSCVDFVSSGRLRCKKGLTSTLTLRPVTQYELLTLVLLTNHPGVPL